MNNRRMHPRPRGAMWYLFVSLALVLSVLPQLAAAQMGLGSGTATNDKLKLETDVPALEAMQREIARRRLMQAQSSAYRALAEGTSPVAEALRANPDIALQYVDENGVPVYYSIHNVVAAATIRTNRVHPGGGSLYSMNGSLTTSNELGVWDAGSALTTHQELSPRVVLGDGAGSHIHSTHVAGTMIAGGVDPLAKGMSFAAGGIRSYEWTNDAIEMAAAAAAGMYTSNHSYGLICGWFFDAGNGWMWFGDVNVSTTEDYRFGQYNQGAVDWDNVAYNAPQYLICKSAGNDRNNNGPAPGSNHWHWSSAVANWVFANDIHPIDGQAGGWDTVDPQSTAKNILTVGAVNDIPGGYLNPASVVMSAFSGWGPTDDGRIKPDVVANGIGLWSSSNANNAAYVSFDGTSMATPNVSGSINLLTQAYMYWGGWAGIGDETPAPRSATIKAIVINTADEAGGANGPDYSNGWGLMNTERAMDTIAHNIATGFDENFPLLGPMGAGETNLPQNTSNTFYFNVDSPLRAPRITVAWTDPAGVVSTNTVDPATARLRNDLDIRLVKIGGGTYFPWALNPAAPGAAATQADNARDNVEKISYTSLPVGDYQMTVTHKGASLVNASQNYSLAWHDIEPIQPPQPTPGSILSVDSHPTGPVKAWTRDNTSSGYYLQALKAFNVTAIGIKADLLQRQTLTVNIYASANQVRGALLATASATVYHPGEVYQYVPINFTFQDCQEYDVSVVWGEVRQLPGFQESGVLPAPFDLDGTFRILNGEYAGNAGDVAFVRLSFIGSAVDPGIAADLDPAQGTPLLNAGGGPDSNQGRGFYFRANQTVALNSFGMEVNHTAGQRLTANLYAATGTTRGALLATGFIIVPGAGLQWHDVPLNYVLEEGEEYDLEMRVGDTTLWHWWSENVLTRPYIKGPIQVFDGELNGDASNSAMPHFRVKFDPGVAANPYEITRPFLGTMTGVTTGGYTFGHYITAIKDQHLTSVGWMANIPLGQTIIVNVYDAVGTVRGGLIATGSLTSNGPGMRWHDVPVAAFLNGGNNYDVEIDWSATATTFEFWTDPVIPQPWTAYGILKVVVGEFGGVPDALDEFVEMRLNSCLGEAATDVPPTRQTPAFVLHAPYPNPTTGSATIDFTLEKESKVSLDMYDVAGRRVARLLDNASRPAGLGSVYFDTRNLPSGIYFVKLQADRKTLTKKLTIMH